MGAALNTLLKKMSWTSAAFRTCAPTGTHFAPLPGEAGQCLLYTHPNTWELKDWEGRRAMVPISHVMEQAPQVQLLAPPCQAFCCLWEPPPNTLPSMLQVASALREGPRNPRAWHEVSCYSDPQGTQKIALPDEPDPDFDPNTILQTQDRLSQDYEALRALAEVMLLVEGMFTKYLLCARP